MSTSGKRILFYNAIPMPHSILLHKTLVENGYEVSFWYYKNLTTLYPWNSIDSTNDYLIFGINGNNLIKLIRITFQSDFVIITGWHTKIHVILALICYFKRIRYAYWLDVPERPKKGLKNIIKTTLLRMADYLFVTGQEGIHRISSWSNIDIFKFRDFPYLGAEVNYDETIELNKERAHCLQKGDKIRVLLTNRFEKRKGYQCVYKALKNMSINELCKFSFTIIGSGTEFEYYKHQFKDLGIEINFKFWVEYQEYLCQIKRTDILIHASLHEPFGIPPIDAMSHGKLSIVSDEVMSTRDRILNGINGYIFKANDSIGLSEILRSVCKNPELVYKLGSNAFLDSKKYQSIYNLNVIKKIMNA